MNKGVDLEKRLEALLARDGASAYTYSPVLIRQALTQLREYRTALEARPAMPEREAIAWIIDPLPFSGPIRRVKRVNGRIASHDEAPRRQNEALTKADAILSLIGGVREAAPERELCPHCNGCGWQNPAQAVDKCETCGGSGVVPAPASPPSAHDMRAALEIADKLDKLHSNQRPLLSAASKALRALASSPMDAVKAAVEAEREACAKVAEHIGRTQNGYTYEGYANDIAQAIRARAGGADSAAILMEKDNG